MAKRINIVRGSAAGTAEISPIDYLGSDFRAYVSACSGSRFDGGKRCQVAQIGDLARIAAALEKAGFQVVADPALIAAVQQQVQVVAQDVSQADARADAVDVKLRERGLSLFPFQRSGVRWLASRKGALLGDDMGCVDGEAIVRVWADGVPGNARLATLYRTPPEYLPKVLSLRDDGEFFWNKIRAVLDKGTKSVVKLSTASGKTLRVTHDHEVCVSEKGEYVRADRLVAGDVVVTTASAADIVMFVEEDGEAHVYDIVCDDPYRNFVANGIVVHNCGKTVQALVAAPEGKPILVVCPAVAKGVWAREAKKWRPDLRVTTLSGRGSFRWPAAGELVAVNYDILPKDMPAGCPAEMTAIADECFPADTMISTPDGEIAIGDIVDKKMHVRVFSQDGDGNIRTMPVVRWIRRVASKKMVRVNHEAGSFVCTEDHKIWTEEYGYTKASELRDCHLSGMRGHDAVVVKQDVLLVPMLGGSPSYRQHDREDLRDMRFGVPRLPGREDVCRPEVLRHKVLGDMAVQAAIGATGDVRKGVVKEGQEAGRRLCRGACPSVGAHARGQEPHPSTRCAGEDVGVPARANISRSRRQREADPSAGGAGDSSWMVSGSGVPWRVDTGAFDPDGSSCREVRVPSSGLQGRHWESGVDVGGRGGREDASDQEVALSGPQEGIRTFRSRVESVEVLESGSRRGSGGGLGEDRCGYVYDLEIETDHNYFANGILVSNCHNLKNGKAQRTQRWDSIAEEVRKLGGRTWLLTATPILNNPFELWAVFSAAGIEREAFGSWNGFIRAFNGVKGRFGYEFGKPTAEVPEMLRKVSLRRKKTDVLKDLPAKIYEERAAELPKDARKACDAALEALDALVGITPEARDEAVEAAAKAADEMAKGRRKTPFEKISEIRALLASAKIPTMLEIVEEHEEAEEPLVVFSAHRMPIDLLAKREGWAVITGDTSAEERTRIETDFQAKKLRGVGCTIKAGGVAITLTRASRALFVDQEWTPALNQQAEDRIYRIGQTRGVVIIQLIGDHVLDERIAELIGKKTTLIDTSVEAARRIDAEEPTLVAPSMLTPEQAAAAEAKAGPRPIEYAPGKRPASNDEERDALSVFQRVNEARGWTDFDRDIGSSFVAQSPRGLSDKQWALMVKIAGKYTRQKPAGAAPGQARKAPEIVLQTPRLAANAVESWAIDALQSLADRDFDFAREKNMSGFNKFDGGPARSILGRYMQDGGKLSPRDWDAAVRIAKHYPRQVGRAPGTDGDGERMENPIHEETYRVEADGDEPIVTTWSEFHEANCDSLSAEELSEIHGLYVGDSFTGGGGAMPEWTVTRIS